MQDFLQYGDKKIEFSIVFKKRKTIGLSISKEDGLKISAPKWVSKKQIKEIVEQKAEWILKKLSEFSEQSGGKTLENGAELFFLGYSCWLEVNEDVALKKIKIFKLDDKIIVNLPKTLASTDIKELLRNSLILWFKKQAELIFRQRIARLSEEMKVNPSKLTIRQQKTRWGSCSSKGNININWRLVMMPITVIDYVLVHELAHLKFLNHSKDFWQQVEAFLPDFKVRKQLLKEYGKKINFLM
jgi:predicted metal-dependent hydrolase